MTIAGPSAADQLLPRDLQERFKTGEVLERQFKLIHGRDAWDPPDRTQQGDREELINRAKTHLPNDVAEAERLALHAWSVRDLPDPGQAALTRPAVRSCDDARRDQDQAQRQSE